MSLYTLMNIFVFPSRDIYRSITEIIYSLEIFDRFDIFRHIYIYSNLSYISQIY